jgi:uncharacterized radical SAM superfamily Fe-S cluster-containing enzyme
MGDVMEKAHPDETESLCPVCLRRIKATRLLRDDEVFLVKECGDHGSFRTVIWRGEPSMAEWRTSAMGLFKMAVLSTVASVTPTNSFPVRFCSR